MTSQKQPRKSTRQSLRTLRVIWHIAAVLFAAVALQLPLAATADAGQRRARLSSDLSAHLAAQSADEVDVILSGSVERIGRLAERHGLRIKKTLSSGAVVTVSNGTLEALAADRVAGPARARREPESRTIRLLSIAEESV